MRGIELMSSRSAAWPRGAIPMASGTAAAAGRRPRVASAWKRPGNPGLSPRVSRRCRFSRSNSWGCCERPPWSCALARRPTRSRRQGYGRGIVVHRWPQPTLRNAAVGLVERLGGAKIADWSKPVVGRYRRSRSSVAVDRNRSGRASRHGRCWLVVRR